MANKYLPGGALNPIWCEEQDAKEMTESITESLMDIFENDDIDASVEINLGEGVVVNAQKSSSNKRGNLCTIIAENDYEAKFNFIKQHSDDPDDLKLAREIIGLKN